MRFRLLFKFSIFLLKADRERVFLRKTAVSLLRKNHLEPFPFHSFNKDYTRAYTHTPFLLVPTFRINITQTRKYRVLANFFASPRERESISCSEYFSVRAFNYS